ncbi:DUF4346 domain-containing protein [Nostoc sp.]|uniref:DUF4346 domain-containing protein n=1 Tax=Nostoc sp. TaxID=1180 RepID=UPI002FFC3B94
MLQYVTHIFVSKTYRNLLLPQNITILEMSNEQGLAIDPETGKPIPATVKVERQPTVLFTGRTAKEICIQLFESTKPSPVSRLDHAAYLGREFMRAEWALVTGQDYVQD